MRFDNWICFEKYNILKVIQHRICAISKQLIFAAFFTCIFIQLCFFLCFFKWNSFNIKHPKCVCCCCCRRCYCTVFFLSIFIMSSRLIEMYSIIFSELFVFYRKTTEYDQWIMCTQQRLFVASNGCWIQRHISLLQRYSHVTNKSWA